MTAAEHKAEEKQVNYRQWAKYIVFTNLPGQWGFPCNKPYTHTAEDNGFLDFYNIPQEEISAFEYYNPQATRAWRNT